MSDESVARALLALTSVVARELAQAESQGEILHRLETVIAPRVESFEYNQGNVSHSLRFDYVDREEWDVGNQIHFLDQRVKPTKEYVDALNEMVLTYPAEQAQADYQLNQFLTSTLRDRDEIADGAAMTAKVTVFLKEVDGAHIDWNPLVWIRGVWVEPDEIQVNPRLLLRRLRPLDLEQERRFHPGAGSLDLGTPSAVLEMHWRATNPLDIQTTVEAVLDVLRLYGLGGVTAMQTELRSSGVLHLGGVSRPLGAQPSIFQYKIAANDRERLARILDLLMPRFQEAEAARFDPTPEEPDSLIIAFRRYKEALSQTGLAEARLTSAITALEALFLRGEERAELTHRLSQRAALLLSLRGLRPGKVYREVSRAYDIRSTYIHGSHIELERQQEAHELSRSIFNYARISILLFLLLQDRVSKDGLIGKIDNALLDDNARAKLKNLVREGLKDRI